MLYKEPSYRVEIKENRLGNLEIELVNKRIRKKYKKLIIEEHRKSTPSLHREYNKHNTEKWLKKGASVYIQVDNQIEQFYKDLNIKLWEQKEISKGRPLRKNMSIDLFNHYFGYSNMIDMGC